MWKACVIKFSGFLFNTNWLKCIDIHIYVFVESAYKNKYTLLFLCTTVHFVCIRTYYFGFMYMNLCIFSQSIWRLFVLAYFSLGCYFIKLIVILFVSKREYLTEKTMVWQILLDITAIYNSKLQFGPITRSTYWSRHSAEGIRIYLKACLSHWHPRTSIICDSCVGRIVFNICHNFFVFNEQWKYCFILMTMN